MLALSESRLVRSAIRLIVTTMSPISSARLPISFITSAESAIVARIFPRPVIDFPTVAAPSRAASLTARLTSLVFSPICASLRAVASSSVADAALPAASVAICSAPLAIVSAE
jgi:hypothetical protein